VCEFTLPGIIKICFPHCYLGEKKREGREGPGDTADTLWYAYLKCEWTLACPGHSHGSHLPFWRYEAGKNARNLSCQCALPRQPEFILQQSWEV